MSFIDWSDCEGMLGLLVEFISDAKQECDNDAGRSRFLTALLRDVRVLSEQAATLFPENARNELQTIFDSIDQEFQEDPVAIHIKDCIEEFAGLRLEHNEGPPPSSGSNR
jgi:hypothetical protein